MQNNIVPDQRAPRRSSPIWNYKFAYSPNIIDTKDGQVINGKIPFKKFCTLTLKLPITTASEEKFEIVVCCKL